MTIDPIDLALDLVRFDTVSPPGTEQACMEHLAALLQGAGFSLRSSSFAAGRTSLVAHCAGTDSARAPLVFTGHLDTVPLGVRPWSQDPAGCIANGRLYGRGASDMKGGVAAFVTAAIRAATIGPTLARGLTLVLTAGEETGCRGARHLAEANALETASGLVVAEPTDNRLALAHKGALHLRFRTHGATAHGSMPDLGDNAVTKAARAIARLESVRLDAPVHPLLGSATATVTSVHGGEAVNVVPDACVVTVDVRTLPGQDHAEVLHTLRACAGSDAPFDPPLVDLPAVGTDPGDPFVLCFLEVMASADGGRRARPIGMPYFTDGSVLQGAYGQCPTVILGPGTPGQAHQTNEWCSLDQISAAADLYEALVRRW